MVVICALGFQADLEMHCICQHFLSLLNDDDDTVTGGLNIFEDCHLI